MKLNLGHGSCGIESFKVMNDIYVMLNDEMHFTISITQLLHILEDLILK